MVIETERLILRPWATSDAEECFRYASDPDVGPAAGWLPHESVEYSREIIRTVLSAPETYAVVLKETGLPVGSVGITLGDAGRPALPEGEAELGCWIGKPYWGRGLIPEAIRALTERCFTVFGCTAVWYACFVGNAKSQRVAEKCGFRYDHTKEDTAWPVGKRDEKRFVLRREEWMG